MRRVLAVAALALLVALPLGAATAPRSATKAPARAAAKKASAAARRDTARAGSATYDSLAWDSVGTPQLYLSWRAPYGMPRAVSDIALLPGDTTGSDTLFLSFETGVDGPDFLGMMARLYIHPAAGDTLGPYWRFTRSGNSRAVGIEFDPDGTFPCPQPWTRNGFGYPSFEFDPAGSKFELYYVMQNMNFASPVSGVTRYCFARLLFRHRNMRMAGALAPVCIEWAEAKFSLHGRDRVVKLGPQRFVSVNSPDGSVTLPYRRAVRPPSWIPLGNRTGARPAAPAVAPPAAPPDTAGTPGR